MAHSNAAGSSGKPDIYKDRDGTYWVEVECPRCGESHGFTEENRDLAEFTADLLQNNALCLNCLEPDRAGSTLTHLLVALTAAAVATYTILAGLH